MDSQLISRSTLEKLLYGSMPLLYAYDTLTVKYFLIIFVPFFIPYIINIFEYLNRLITQYFKNNDFSVDYLQNSTDGENQFYNYISIFINSKLDDLKINTFESVKNNSDILKDKNQVTYYKSGIDQVKIDVITPIYSIVGDIYIKFEFLPNIIVHLKKSSMYNNKNDIINQKITIMADSLKKIKLFEQEVNKFIKIFKEQNIDKNKISTFIINEVGIMKWIDTPLTVKKSFDNIFIDDKIKQSLIYDINTFKKNKDFYKRIGCSYKRGYMFEGMPGTGKTSITLAIATYLDTNIYTINLNHYDNIEILNKAFNQIPPNSVIFFDDIDTSNIVKKRKITTEEEENKIIKHTNITLADILKLFDGYTALDGNIIIMCTNNINDIDPALIRPGRIDMHYHIDNMTLEIIKQIMDYYFQPVLNQVLDQVLDPVLDKKLSCAVFLNTIVIPNVDNIDVVLQYLQDKIKEYKTT